MRVFWPQTNQFRVYFDHWFDKNQNWFDQGQFLLFDVAPSVFLHFALCLLDFTPEKLGPIDSPRRCAFTGLFSSQTDNFSPEFDHFFDQNRHLATFSFPTCTALAASSNHSAASGASGLSICMHIDMNVLKGCNIFSSSWSFKKRLEGAREACAELTI